eukprot:scaffold77661_cov51-Phaeocystis_antarctica.AAC.1
MSEVPGKKGTRSIISAKMHLHIVRIAIVSLPMVSIPTIGVSTAIFLRRYTCGGHGGRGAAGRGGAWWRAGVAYLILTADY